MQVQTQYSQGQRTTLRRVQRVLRRVDPWSVFKLSLLFYASVALIFLFAGTILYFVGLWTGAVDSVEQFIQGIGWPEFEIRTLNVFRIVIAIGLIEVLTWTGINVFVAFLYNLVADLIGGVQLTMTEREY